MNVVITAIPDVTLAVEIVVNKIVLKRVIHFVAVNVLVMPQVEQRP